MCFLHSLVFLINNLSLLLSLSQPTSPHVGIQTDQSLLHLLCTLCSTKQPLR
uniref:Uncharacterized protein n=1 Tax=Arundo donax TaxID=35708 RepID=A0A0A8YNX3_ARUDO